MLKSQLSWAARRPNAPSGGAWSRAFASLLLLLVAAGFQTAFAANLLTNPGFEDGLTAWSGVVRGSTVTLVADPGVAHSGNNCAQMFNASGWSSASQGDTRGGWSTGVTINVSDAKYYKLSAWVKVPGASVTPASVTLRYRFEPSGARVDVGGRTIDTEAWTYLESGWIKPNIGDTYVSYWEVHSVANAVTFLADDCGLEEGSPMTLNGRVVDKTGAGVDNATVSAASAGYSSELTTTSGGGYYTLQVPPGTYTVGAGAPGLKGSTTVTVASDPTTAPNIVLDTDPDYDIELVFSAFAPSIPATGAWPAAYPAGTMLTRIGSPGTQIIDGVQWAKNVDTNHNGPGWRVGGENLGPIGVTGATAVAVVRMGDTRTVSNNWDSVIDVFYDRLVLGVRNDTGLVNVRLNGNPLFAPAGTELAEGQKAVLSMVVQPEGTFKVYINGTEAMTGVAQDPVDMYALTPGVETFKHYINVARNDPDGWTAFNGNIGDVYLYNLALPDAKRTALEAKMLTKYSIDPTVYTITSSVSGVGGTITPVGAVKVPGGVNKTFTITPANLYRIDKVLVDGVDQGPVASYTFLNVTANGHTIVASFTPMPSQTVYGKVTDGTEGVYPATVYFKPTPDATNGALFTAKVVDLDGNYSVRVPQGTWYAAAGATAYNTSPDAYPVVVGLTPLELNFTLVKQISLQQPLLTGKGAGVARTNHDGTIGYQFNTGSTAIDVKALGFVDWDLDGLVDSHRIGIWSVADHAQLAEVTVPAGTVAPLTGDFRYVNLDTPVRLEANTAYVVGAEVILNGLDKWPDTAPPAGLGQPDFAYVTGITSFFLTPGFGEPTTTWITNHVGAAVNLIGKAVPAPILKGMVKDAFGKGIPNSVVQVGFEGPATITDAAGKYRIIGVPQGAGQEVFADNVGYGDVTATVDTTNADVTPVVTDITLTAKVETGVIQNGGFEAGTAGWTINNASPGDIMGVTSPGWSGGFAAKFTPAGGTSWSWLSQKLPIIPGSVYTAYFKGYTDPSVTEWFPMIAFRNDIGDELKGWISGEPGLVGWVHVPPKEWKQYLLFQTYSGDATKPFVRITPPEGATFIDLWVGGVAGTSWGGASSYADDAVIDRVGPDATPGPYTTVDVLECLRRAGGLATVPSGYMPRYDLVTNGKVDVSDAIRVARKVAGLDTPNP